MRFYEFQVLGLLLTVALLFFSCQSEKKDGPVSLSARPNILWITCEDMSPRLGAYGDSLAHTPNIDQLAKEGIKYTNAFSISGVCSPSRAALITGLYPTSFAAMHMRTIKRTASIAQITDPELLAIPVYEAVPPAEVKCFSELLRRQGYYCTNNSKEDYQFHAPVTAWDESSNEAHYKNRKDKSQPFFAVFNIGDTHESRVWANADSASYTDPADVILPPYYPDTEVIRRDLARHYDNIRMMDQKVGKLLKELEQSGEADNTIVFFFSDHGDGLPRAKRWIYDSGIKVPLIVRFPDGQGAGTTDDQLVSFVDFPPTLLSLAGAKIPEYMQGQAFLGEAKSKTERDYIYAARDRMDPVMDYVRGVRDKRYKFIKNYWPDEPYVQFLPYRDQMALMQELLRLDSANQLTGIPALWFAKTRPEVEFYDTQNDPYEVNNLADDPQYAQKIAEMHQALKDWETRTNDMGGIPEPELIKQIWPPDGVQPQTAECTHAVGKDKEVELSSATEGTSIAYRYLSAKDTSDWLLYTQPFVPRQDTLQVMAHRIGYLPSDQKVIELP